MMAMPLRTHLYVWGQIQLLVVIAIRNDFRSVDFDIGVPLPKSHIHNVFKPVNIISVDNGQTEKKGQVACFRIYVYGNSATQGKGEMSLDGTSGARSGRS